jgi:hypothetical protein
MAFVDLCRLCGTDTLNTVRNAIFKGEGRIKKYALKISGCLTLKVSHQNSQPKLLGKQIPPGPWVASGLSGDRRLSTYIHFKPRVCVLLAKPDAGAAGDWRP